MPVQPKLLTVIIASADLAATYTTLHAVQATRYRNLEIVCVLSGHYKTLKAHMTRDFGWVPLITAPYASVSSLLEQCTARAHVSYCDAILYIQAGATLEPNRIHELVEEYNRLPKADLLMPTIVRRDGSGAVYGAKQAGKWPHQLQSVVNQEELKQQKSSHFVGGACMARIKTCLKYPFGDSADDLALLYWTEQVLENGATSYVSTRVSVVFEGILYSDFSDMMMVPSAWYRDAERYIAARGTWYDKLAFAARFRWRTQTSIIGRAFQIVLGSRFNAVRSRL